MEEISEENFSTEKKSFPDEKSEIENGNEISPNGENLKYLNSFQVESSKRIENDSNSHIQHINDKNQNENFDINDSANQNGNRIEDGISDVKEKEKESKENKNEILISPSVSPITVQRTLHKNSTEPFEYYLFIGLDVTVYLASKQGETKRKKAVIIGEKGSSIVTVEIVSKNTAKSGKYFKDFFYHCNYYCYYC